MRCHRSAQVQGGELPLRSARFFPPKDLFLPIGKKSSFYSIAVLLLMLLAAAQRSDAGTIIYDSTTNGNYGTFGLISDGIYRESFSTGASPVVLTSVSAVFNRYASDTGTITATLLADAGATPGAVLTTIGTAPSSTLATFTSVSPYLLAANTRYWVQMTEPAQPGGAGVGWTWSYQIAGLTGVAGEYVQFNNGNVYTTASFGVYLMTVTVDTPPPPPPPPVASVPEPSTEMLAVVAGTAFSVVAFHRRQSRRRK